MRKYILLKIVQAINNVCRLFRKFFRAGQVLETVRGAGVEQEAIHQASHLLDNGHWVYFSFLNLNTLI